MNSRTQRRDDRSAADPYKQWAPADPKYSHDHDTERRRNRSATVPSNSYDPRSYPSQYNDPRQPSRSHRQDPHHPPAAPHPSYHVSAQAQAPATSRAHQYPTRTAQHSSSGYHYPQPSSFQPSHTAPAYPVASSSRRPHPETSDPRSSKRTAPAPVQQTYEHMSGGEEMPRPSRHASRPLHSSTHPPTSAPPNQTFWNPTQDLTSSRRHKDSYVERERDQGRGREGEKEREREREREKERERDKPTAELENRYKDRARPERYRERERERERAPEARYQEPSRTRPYDKRKDSDTEGPSYPDPRSASKVSLTGREGHPTAAREPSSGHRRHRTEDGTTSTGRRHQSENTQNPITTMPSQSTGVPQPDAQQTGEPPPAPRVMPVYLPSKAKSQRSHRDGRPSTAQGAQSGSDTERATGKHRMERTPSGPAIQRHDAHASSSTRDRSNHDVQLGPRDDARRLEGKYGAHQDIRQPLAPINVDIPLVTPGFNASTLPAETRPPIAQQIVSIRAGQGPSDPHDAHFKSSAISHSGAPQDIDILPPHPPSASIVKAPSRTRLQSSETRTQPDRPAVVERSRTEPHVGDLPPGQRMSIHESRAMPIPISKPSYPRGNPEIGADNASSSYPHSRPPSRSAHRTSVNNTVPPAVAGPRPLRSASQGPQVNEPPTRPPSMAQHGPISSSIPNQQSVPQSSHPTNGSPSRTGHNYGSLSSSAQPSPKNAQLHSVTLSHSTSTQHAPSAPPSTHQTPVIVSQTFASSSRPSTRDGAHANAPTAHQQSADRQSTVDIRPGLRQASNSTTLEAAWVVQTPATVRNPKISREDKYLRDHRFNSETPHPQLRQVLSQDDDPFRRASSSMMKASQATTPTTSSQRNSPGTKSRDVPFGTPRGTSANNSPRYGSAKQAPTPDHIPRQSLLPQVTGPPQIAIVGATPITMVRELPQGRVDHGLLAPFPAPTRTSRTTSSSQDQLSQPPQPAVGITSPTSHQPPLVQVVRAPSLFQPYRPPSLPIAEDNGQSSPPPIPIPPPKGPEDSPPPIETRTSEIIPTRSQSAEPFQSYALSVPEVQSEMFHLPSRHPVSSLLPSMPPPHTAHNVQPSKPDNNSGPTPMLDRSADVAQVDAKLSKPPFSLPDDVPVVHQEIMLSVPILPSLPLAPPARLRPKVTIEDVPEYPPVLSKPVTATAPTATPAILESRPVQPSYPTTLARANSSSQSAVVDQPTHRYSPQANNKDSPLYRGAEPTTMPTAPPMPPPPPIAAPMSARVPSYPPPPQATPFPSAPAAPAQRAVNTGLSRTYQRAAEMLQTSKLSTSTNLGPIRYVNKSAAAPVQSAYNPAVSVTGQHQPVNNVSIQGPSSSRPVYATTTLPTTSATASIPKATAHQTTIGPGPPGGASGSHISAPSNNGVNIPPPSFADMRQQPSRPGPLLMPSADAPSTSVSSTIAVRNPHQEQPIVDSTRPRDVPSATRPIPPSSHTYPTTTRPSTSTATTTQHTHVNPVQPSTHHRVASLPTTTSSSAVQKPPSPRKYSQPIPPTSASTQPFPARPPAPEYQSARAPVSAPVFPPAPVRSARLPFPDRTNDPDMLKTPSSIAPSPMLNPDTSHVVPQHMAVPIRTRKSSTDSKDDKKKPGIFGTIFRTRTLSSKAAEAPVVSTTARASVDQVRVQPDVSVVAPAPVPRGVTSTSAPKESSSSVPPATSASFYARSQAKPKARMPDPIVFPPPKQAPREHRDTTPHIFTPFKFLHSKRNRTMSAASLDVCDGNTATNTVIGSPDHSTLGQAQPLPPIVTPGTRDPLIAATEWRDREEAERRERRTHRIRRPGVTFDLEEEPPSPAPGTANRRKRLIRRGSGRTHTPGTPGPSRG